MHSFAIYPAPKMGIKINQNLCGDFPPSRSRRAQAARLETMRDTAINNEAQSTGSGVKCYREFFRKRRLWQQLRLGIETILFYLLFH